MIRAAFIALATLALAGCAAAPAPTPTPTAEGCTPSSAAISWEPSTGAGEALVGVQELTFATDGGEPSIQATDLDVVPVVGGLDDSMDAESWATPLIDAARENSDAGSDFGLAIDVEKEFVQITNPEAGKYVVTIVAAQRSIIANVDCGDGPVPVTVTAVLPSSAEAVPMRCVDGIEGDDVRSKAVREYCA